MPDDPQQPDTPQPSTPVGTGRRPDGRFAVGNQAARGNPNNIKAQQIREAVFSAITDNLDRLKAAIEMQLVAAETGDLEALKFLLDRSIGKVASDSELQERIERLEQHAAQQRQNGNGVHR